MQAEWTRRDFLWRSGAAVAVATANVVAAKETAPATLQRASLPGTRGRVARIGLGTWQAFDVGAGAAERAPLAEVLRVLAGAGAEVVDTSPMYGRAEAVLGDLAAETGLAGQLFVATKVWTRGEAAGVAQMEESLRKLRRERVALMQVHNLVDWRTHLRTLRRWKDEGRVEAIGVTHYLESAYDEVECVLRAEAVDFVQLPLSLDQPLAAERMLGVAAERGVAFIANRPFGGGGALRRLREVPLPAWAEEYAIGSWAQFFLKWILSHGEVACAIPGTSNPRHMADNLGAGRGEPLDARMRARLAAHYRAI